MLLRYHIEKLEQILSDFYHLTGMGISVLDADLHPLVKRPDPPNPFCRMIQDTKNGACRCYASDQVMVQKCLETRQAVTHRCHAGLTDTVVPILQDDTLLGFVMFGQVCETEADKAPFCEIEPLIRDLDLDEQALEAAYDRLMLFDRSKIDGAAAIVSMLTKYICMEHVIRAQYNEEFEALVSYVETHLTEPLTVSFLCRKFHFSKNTLYRLFKLHFNCTVGDYVTRLRMKQAELLLTTTELPIYEVCEQAGIDNYQYFCRRFKQESGLTPLQYRKQAAKDQKYKLQTQLQNQ